MLRAAAARRTLSTLSTAMGFQRRLLGAGYTGPREAGYDEGEMNRLRALGDQPFFMLNLLKVVDMDKFFAYNSATAGIFKELLTILLAIAFWGDRVTATNIIGFLISVAGIMMYNWHKWGGYI